MSFDLIRIILVDDHKLVRESIGSLLDNDARFSVIKMCENGHEAIHEAHNLKPDIMLVDINMQPVNGFEVVEKVLTANPSIKIIALSVNNQTSYISKMLNLGAKGYVTKGSPYDEIAKAIVEVNKGQTYLSADIRNMF
jgi:two-component system, NarL family, invasion response regulator UvrY